jgi:DNA-binding winged helix-turn-helix (wHTH) protein
MAKEFYEFGSYRLCISERTLFRANELVPLRPKEFATLLCLVRRAGAVVSQSELIANIWQNTSVSENNLAKQIGALRKRLGKDAAGQDYIRTIPNEGYIMTAAVTIRPEPVSCEPQPEAERSGKPNAQRALAWSAIAALACMAAFVASYALRPHSGHAHAYVAGWAAIAPYTSASIASCTGAFVPSSCSTALSSSGKSIRTSGAINTSGDNLTYTASSVALAASLGGAVAVNTTTSNSSGPGVMVIAREQFVDVLTISYAPLNGLTGHLVINYTLHGANNTTGHNISYGCVKAGINEAIFAFGCTAYSQPSVAGTFESATYSFSYGQPFPLWFQLESIAGTGFGPGRKTGTGSSAANFANDAAIKGLVLFDQNMNALTGTPNIASALNISYQSLSR